MTLFENIKTQLHETSHHAGFTRSMHVEDREMYLLIHPSDLKEYNQALAEQFAITNPFITGGVREKLEQAEGTTFTKIMEPHVGTTYIIPSDLIKQGSPKVLLDLKFE